VGTYLIPFIGWLKKEWGFAVQPFTTGFFVDVSEAEARSFRDLNEAVLDERLGQASNKAIPPG
jgi:hypothetical protein